MRELTARWVAEAAGGELVAGDPAARGPLKATIDTRESGTGDLFFGLEGERADGGAHADAALAAGAWGVLVAPKHAERAAVAATRDAVVIAAADPLVALQSLARAWRRELGCKVVGVTGSTGKTSTKDILAAVLAPHLTTHATHENLNTEIGLPLTILEAAPGTQALVLEMAMRGAGQIAELAAIAEPDVGVIVNVGPVHLELLGDIQSVARAKAELIAGLRPGAVAIVPAGEPLLAPYLRADVETVTFGPGGEVDTLPPGLELPFSSAHMRSNALAALAAARALGVEPQGRLEVELSRMRGQRIELPGGIVVIDDCYNANPMSMRAALDDLAETAPGRRVAVLGDMRELGPDERRYHAELGVQAREAGVDLLVTVGELASHAAAGFGSENVHAVADAQAAAHLVPGLLEPGDTVLVKASRGVGLEAVTQALTAGQER
jgi:UDP-N-acetylmuramoyl-tripeptide--D-alanyl-D-alanine ligase